MISLCIENCSYELYELCNITAEFLSDVCLNVGTEPSLQPITGEHPIHQIANGKEGALLDIARESFGGSGQQHACLDIRVFSPFAHT